MTPTTKNPAAVALGTLGGRTKTAAKSAAARENGLKGGRPRSPHSKIKVKSGRPPGRPRTVRLDF